LNPALRRYLGDWRLRDRDLPVDLPVVSERRSRTYALVDRLTEQEVGALVQSYLEGTPAHELAERYGVSLSSVKRLLRQQRAQAEPAFVAPA
jgi:DNA-directed RNA polymerase specialized sigma24 family protein